MDGERMAAGITGVWPLVDVLVCNHRFLVQVTGFSEIEDGLRTLTRAGPARVAVTLGHKGVVGLVGDRVFRVPPFRWPWSTRTEQATSSTAPSHLQNSASGHSSGP